MLSCLSGRGEKLFWCTLFFKAVCAEHLCEAWRLPLPEKIFLARAAVGCTRAALPLTVEEWCLACRVSCLTVCLGSLCIIAVCAEHLCEAWRLPLPEKIFLARATSLHTGGFAAHGLGSNACHAKHLCEAWRLPVPEKIFLARATSLHTGGFAAHG